MAAKKKAATKKPASKKPATKKPAAKKAAPKKPAAKKAAPKKAAPKKAAPKKAAKTAKKKPVAKKAAPKKPVAKKTATRTPAAKKKTATKTPAAKKKTAPKQATTSGADLEGTFAQLRSILAEASKPLDVKHDEEGRYATVSKKPWEGKELFFGAVLQGRRDVSYHLFPVYVFPAMLETISPALKKRMQGQTCFNFTRPDTELFDELRRLTKAGLERFHDEGLV